MPDLPDYDTRKPLHLPADGPWPAAVHRFDADTVGALLAAEATGRPLLIRGRPGTGKSQTARAAAAAGKRPLLSFTVNGRTEADDLKARFDAVRRLADAQARITGDPPLPPQDHYLQPGVLWWAFHWAGAQSQLQSSMASPAGDGGAPVPESATRPPKGWRMDQDRCVLLLDEVDKADPGQMDSLLDALGSNGFKVPMSDKVVSCPAERRPLILLTTNEERELSDAVLRRCLVLRLDLPADPEAMQKYLLRIGHEHQQLLADPNAAADTGTHGAPLCLVLKEAAALVAQAHFEKAEGQYRPATSEYLDLAQALSTLAPGDRRKQKALLNQLKNYVVSKSADGHA